jgi:hypothetical protein
MNQRRLCLPSFTLCQTVSSFAGAPQRRDADARLATTQHRYEHGEAGRGGLCSNRTAQPQLQNHHAWSAMHPQHLSTSAPPSSLLVHYRRCNAASCPCMDPAPPCCSSHLVAPSRAHRYMAPPSPYTLIYIPHVVFVHLSPLQVAQTPKQLPSGGDLSPSTAMLLSSMDSFDLDGLQVRCSPTSQDTVYRDMFS